MWLSLGAVVLVAVGATAVVALAVARSITRPTADLRRAAMRIAEGDLSARAAIKDAPRELSELAHAFDDMAARLEELVESQRAFVADASHQLRTPLTALRLRLENLEATVADSETEDVGGVVVEAERLSRLVDQLLELSRAGSADTVAVDVVDVIEQRVRLWETVADEAGIELRTDIASDDRCVASVIPDGLEQVLDNLLDNAIRYSHRGGTVNVAMRATSDGSCVVEVADTGEGVTDEELPRIFDRFWRGGSEQPGTGLGLAIVSHLVGRSGGSVTAHRGAEGGLVVAVRLVAITEKGSTPLE